MFITFKKNKKKLYIKFLLPTHKEANLKCVLILFANNKSQHNSCYVAFFVVVALATCCLALHHVTLLCCYVERLYTFTFNHALITICILFAMSFVIRCTVLGVYDRQIVPV